MGHNRPMSSNKILIEAYERINQVVHQATDGLDAAGLSYRPETGSNSIAWLVWHLTRVQDDHVAEIADTPQVWAEPGWIERTGIDRGAAEMGMGDGPADVAAIQPSTTEGLLAYHDEVMNRSYAYLAGADDGELDRIIDDSYTPPVTVGVRLVSVISDNIQHAGQARYLRGMIDRLA